jgi:carbon-monoxide dehydrogenase medium subunit
MNEFGFHRPATLEDALATLAASEDARALAGGQSLLPAMKLGLAAPSDLVDLSAIAQMKGIAVGKDGLRIGALATHAEVAASADVRGAIPALARLADGIGDPAIRERGTLGGSLANNDPAACYPAALLALGATVHTDRRSIAADDFLTGLYETALEPGELIVSVGFPVPEKASYQKFMQPASRYALVGVFVARSGAGVRVAVTGAAACAFRSSGLEAALSANWSAASCDGVEIPDDELNTDMHASAAYRAHLIRVLARRAVEQAD